MHSLVNTFVCQEEPLIVYGRVKALYPIRISLGTTKSKVLFFDSQDLQTKWFKTIEKVSGLRNIKEFYKFDSVIG